RAGLKMNWNCTGPVNETRFGSTRSYPSERLNPSDGLEEGRINISQAKDVARRRRLLSTSPTTEWRRHCDRPLGPTANALGHDSCRINVDRVQVVSNRPRPNTFS